MEPATFCWAECIRYFRFSSTCRVRRRYSRNVSVLTFIFVHVFVLCLFLPGEYQNLWQGFPLCPLWVWLSSLFAVSRSAPHPPPSSHQTRTGKKKGGRHITLQHRSHVALLTYIQTNTNWTNLRVLQEGGLVIDAASGPVAKGVLAVDPGAPHHLLLPGFVDAQVGGVDEAAQN